MTTAFPSSLDTYADPAGGSVQGSTTPTHSGHHTNHNDAIEALEAKLGTGASTPSANTVLRGTGTGTSGYGQVVNADVAAAAAVAVSKLAAGGTANRVVVTVDGTTMSLQQIGGGMIGNGSIGSSHLASDSVSLAAMQDSSVGTAELLDANVTTAKLAANAATQAAVALDGAAASIASGSSGTVPGMSVTLSTTGGPVQLMGTITVYVDAAPATAIIRYSLDGGAEVTVMQLSLEHAISNVPGTFALVLTGLSGTPSVPVSHTIVMKWQTTASTLRRNGTSWLSLIELKR